MNGHPPDRTRSTSPKHPLTSPAMSASEAKPNGITVWLEGLSMDGVNLEYIVRDPKWEDSWERAIISMRTEGFHRGEE